MFADLFKVSGWRKAPEPLEAHNENMPAYSHADHVDPEKVRALRTGAALAVSLDATPAVLVNIYDYAHNVRRRGRD